MLWVISRLPQSYTAQSHFKLFRTPERPRSSRETTTCKAQLTHIPQAAALLVHVHIQAPPRPMTMAAANSMTQHS